MSQFHSFLSVLATFQKKLSITHNHSVPRAGLSMGRSLLGKEDQYSQFLFFEETQINQALRLQWLFTPRHVQPVVLPKLCSSAWWLQFGAMQGPSFLCCWEWKPLHMTIWQCYFLDNDELQELKEKSSNANWKEFANTVAAPLAVDEFWHCWGNVTAQWMCLWDAWKKCMARNAIHYSFHEEDWTFPASLYHMLFML